MKLNIYELPVMDIVELCEHHDIVTFSTPSAEDKFKNPVESGDYGDMFN